MTAAAERARELLVDYATEGLGPRRARELDRLLPRCPGLDRESFELAAAAIELAATAAGEPLPATLRDRLARQARDFCRHAPRRPAAAAAGAKP